LYSVGEDLLGMTVTQGSDGVLFAQHASHASHGSHTSHRSHTSGG
jgi:hypothetical protein